MTKSNLTDVIKIKQYSIKDLEYYSGIKAHTIRIWEQRYQMLKPKRTLTNIRYYTDDDLKFIMNVGILNANGLKISHIANLSKDEFDANLSNISNKINGNDSILNELLIATIDFSEESINKIFLDYTEAHGFENTIADLIFPFLQKIGVLWLTGSIYSAQEHFISNLIRQKISVEIDKLPSVKSKPNIVIFTPEEEYHEIPVLFSYYLLKKHKFNVIYLGVNVPINDLYLVYQKYTPKYFFCNIITHPNSKVLPNYLTQISKRFQKSTFYLSGMQAMNVEEDLFPNISVIKSFDHYKSLIKNL